MLNPYATEGTWVKVNLHMHTSRSDGRWEPGAAIAAYRLDGYGCLAVTDHDLLFDPAKESGAGTSSAPAREPSPLPPPTRRGPVGAPPGRGCPLQAGAVRGEVGRGAGACQPDAGGILIIPAQEVHLGADRRDRCEYHIVGLGISEAIPRQRTGQEAVDAIRAQGGLALLCHPLWSDMRQEEMDAIRGCLAVELWNGVCERLLGRGNSVFYWDSYLSRFDPQPLAPGEPPRPLWGVAVDDAHRYPDDVGSGWVWVQLTGDACAASSPVARPVGCPPGGRGRAGRSRREHPAGKPGRGTFESAAVEAVLAALRRGAFYSSQGPRIETVILEGSRLVVYTSSAVAVRFVGSGGRMRSRVTGAHVKSAEYDIVGDERYVRVEVEDRGGRVAWSNPVWVAPLEGALTP